MGLLAHLMPSKNNDFHNDSEFDNPDKVARNYGDNLNNKYNPKNQLPTENSKGAVSRGLDSTRGVRDGSGHGHLGGDGTQAQYGETPFRSTNRQTSHISNDNGKQADVYRTAQAVPQRSKLSHSTSQPVDSKSYSSHQNYESPSKLDSSSRETTSKYLRNLNSSSSNSNSQSGYINPAETASSRGTLDNLSSNRQRPHQEHSTSESLPQYVNAEQEANFANHPRSGDWRQEQNNGPNRMRYEDGIGMVCVDRCSHPSCQRFKSDSRQSGSDDQNYSNYNTYSDISNVSEPHHANAYNARQNTASAPRFQGDQSTNLGNATRIENEHSPVKRFTAASGIIPDNGSTSGSNHADLHPQYRGEATKTSHHPNTKESTNYTKNYESEIPDEQEGTSLKDRIYDTMENVKDKIKEAVSGNDSKNTEDTQWAPTSSSATDTTGNDKSLESINVTRNYDNKLSGRPYVKEENTNKFRDSRNRGMGYRGSDEYMHRSNYNTDALDDKDHERAEFNNSGANIPRSQSNLQDSRYEVPTYIPKQGQTTQAGFGNVYDSSNHNTHGSYMDQDRTQVNLQDQTQSNTRYARNYTQGSQSGNSVHDPVKLSSSSNYMDQDRNQINMNDRIQGNSQNVQRYPQSALSGNGIHNSSNFGSSKNNQQHSTNQFYDREQNYGDSRFHPESGNIERSHRMRQFDDEGVNRDSSMKDRLVGEVSDNYRENNSRVSERLHNMKEKVKDFVKGGDSSVDESSPKYENDVKEVGDYGRIRQNEGSRHYDVPKGRNERFDGVHRDPYSSGYENGTNSSSNRSYGQTIRNSHGEELTANQYQSNQPSRTQRVMGYENTRRDDRTIPPDDHYNRNNRRMYDHENEIDEPNCRTHAIGSRDHFISGDNYIVRENYVTNH